MLKVTSELFGWDTVPSDVFRLLPSVVKTTKGKSVSMYAPAINSGTTTMSMPILKAFAIWNGFNYREGAPNPPCAIGTTASGTWVVELEYEEDPNMVYTSAYNPDNGIIRAGIYSKSSSRMQEYSIKSDGGTLLWLAMMGELMNSVELLLCASVFDKTGLYDPDEINALWDQFAIVCANVYYRTTSACDDAIRIEPVAETDSGTVEKISLSALRSRRNTITEVIKGEFQITGKKKDESGDAATARIDLGADLSEKTRPFLVENLDAYVLSETAENVIRVIKTGFERPELSIRNFYFIGPPGSGKSEDAKGIAYYTGLPYYVQTLSSGTTEENLKGFLLPVTDDDIDEYGQRKASEEPSENAERIVTSGNGLRYRYLPSPLVLAGMYGGVIEVAEGQSARDTTSLTCLNEFMNRPDGILETPIGPIRRHPKCIVIMTDNFSTDIGYGKLNQAVKDRAGTMTFWYERPNRKRMLDMLKASGIELNQRVAEVMANAIEAIDTAANRVDNSIKGVAGFRSFRAWAQAYTMGFSMQDSFELCVLNKICTNPEEREFLRDFADANTNVYGFEG